MVETMVPLVQRTQAAVGVVGGPILEEAAVQAEAVEVQAQRDWMPGLMEEMVVQV